VTPVRLRSIGADPWGGCGTRAGTSPLVSPRTRSSPRPALTPSCDTPVEVAAVTCASCQIADAPAYARSLSWVDECDVRSGLHRVGHRLDQVYFSSVEGACLPADPTANGYGTTTHWLNRFPLASSTASSTRSIDEMRRRRLCRADDAPPVAAIRPGVIWVHSAGHGRPGARIVRPVHAAGPAAMFAGRSQRPSQ